MGGRHGRNNAADGVSEGAGPGIYNYRRVFGRSSRGTEQKPEDASICTHDGRNWGFPGKIGEGCARSRRKCNFGGPACPKPCRRAASPRVPGPEFTIIAGSFGRSSRDTEHKPEDASMGGSRGREWPQPKKM